MSSKTILKNYSIHLLKDKVLPCSDSDIDDMIINRRRWERTEFFLEYLYELLLVVAFAAVFIDSKIVMSILIGSIGCCSKLILNSQKNQNKITEKLNIFLENYHVKSIIPDDNNANQIMKNYTENPLRSRKSNNTEDNYESKETV